MTIMVPATEMEEVFTRVLSGMGMEQQKAGLCSSIFTKNSVDGVLTHGVYRFERFVSNIQEGVIDMNAVPECRHQFNGFEQWDGRQGPGILNAITATRRAMGLAGEFGLGAVALANTNHWMRGGTYARMAAEGGMAFIGWTNTTANMPAWGALDCRLGNNPLVMGIPHEDSPIVLDMAMSQFSYGMMEMKKLKQEKLPLAGGYNKEGSLTNDPDEILVSRRPLPVGYWKGAGLSLVLDLFATVLTGGKATHEISKHQTETSLSQVFICIDLSHANHSRPIQEIISGVLHDYHESIPSGESKIIFPGENTVEKRKASLKNGIPVLKETWDRIKRL